jgi:hypothetical protein
MADLLGVENRALNELVENGSLWDEHIIRMTKNRIIIPKKSEKYSIIYHRKRMNKQEQDASIK